MMPVLLSGRERMIGGWLSRCCDSTSAWVLAHMACQA